MTPANQVFVFGSNREGRHGKGAAREALRNWGAIYGQASGRQGNSYAIVTKELRYGYMPVGLAEVYLGVCGFIEHAIEREDEIFLLTPIGCGLAGFKPSQIAPMFRDAPKNVMLPDEFISELKS